MKDYQLPHIVSSYVEDMESSNRARCALTIAIINLALTPQYIRSITVLKNTKILVETVDRSYSVQISCCEALNQFGFQLANQVIPFEKGKNKIKIEKYLRDNLITLIDMVFYSTTDISVSKRTLKKAIKDIKVNYIEFDKLVVLMQKLVLIIISDLAETLNRPFKSLLPLELSSKTRKELRIVSKAFIKA